MGKVRAPLNALVTGEIGVGKSTACRRVIDMAIARGHKVGGILTPAIHDPQGEKTGIAIVDLASREQRLLGVVDQGQPGVKVGRYRFDPESVAWGRRALELAVDDGCDLLVVDEIGHLELRRGEGFVNALDIIPSGTVRRTLTIVRRALVGLYLQRLPGTEMRVFEVTEANRDEMPARISEWLLPQP